MPSHCSVVWVWLILSILIYKDVPMRHTTVHSPLLKGQISHDDFCIYMYYILLPKSFSLMIYHVCSKFHRHSLDFSNATAYMDATKAMKKLKQRSDLNSQNTTHILQVQIPAKNTKPAITQWLHCKVLALLSIDTLLLSETNHFHWK